MKSQGAAAEDAALTYLESHGLRLNQRNFRCRYGEIDLIMRDGATLVFIEVRFRRHSRFGGAEESITAFKQQRIVAAARYYLAGQPVPPPCRFDVVLLSPNSPARWIKNAFTEY